MLPWPVGLWRLLIFKGENSADVILQNVLVTLSYVRTICFRLGMFLSITKLYSLIPVWMTLMLAQGHRVMRKLKLVQSFVVKLHEATQMLWIIDSVREVIVEKSCNYGKYGSLEHLLFFSFLFLSIAAFLTGTIDLYHFWSFSIPWPWLKVINW